MAGAPDRCPGATAPGHVRDLITIERPRAATPLGVDAPGHQHRRKS
jgi:hypothetical protein